MSRRPRRRGPTRGWLLRRQLGADRGPLLTLLGLVAVTALLASVVPRLLNATADEALDRTLAAAPVEAQEIVGTSTNDQSEDQLDEVDQQLRDGMTAELRALIGDRAVASSTALNATYLRADPSRPSRPKPFAWLRVRYQQGVFDEVEWVQGRAPAGGSTVEVPTEGRLLMLELAVSRVVAETLDLEVGEELVLDSAGGTLVGNGPFAIRVVGIFEPRTPARPLWTYDRQMLEPGAEVTPDGNLTAELGTGLIDREGLARLRSAVPTLSHEWHYSLDTSRLDGGNVLAASAGISRVTARGVSLEAVGQVSPLGSVPSVNVDSGMLDVLEDYLEQGSTATAVWSLMLAGLFVLALLVVGLGALATVQRRAESLRLARARGASVAQLLAMTLLESLLVCLPVALGAVALARWLVPARPAPLGWVLVAALVVVCLGFVAVGTVRGTRSLAPQARGDLARSRPSVRVLAAQLLVIGVSVTAVVLLRTRGIGAGSGGDTDGNAGGVIGGDGGGDPLLAAAPVLVGVSAAILALHATPWLVGPLVRLAGRRPGAVGFVALARAARQPAAAVAPLLVLLLGLSLSVFAASVATTVLRGQEESSWLTVGADYRLDSFGLKQQQVEAVEAVPGVRAVAAAYARDDVRLSSGDVGDVAGVRFVAVDAESYSGVAADAPPGVIPVADWRAGIAGADRDGQQQSALPGLVAPQLARLVAGSDSPLGLTMPTIGFTEVAPVATSGTFATVRSGTDFVVVPLDALQEGETFPILPTMLFVAGGAGLGDELAEASGGAEAGVAVADRRATLQATTDLPFVGATVASFRLGVAAAAAYCLLAVMLALVLTARSRTGLAAVMSTLGLSRRQSRRLVALELAPIVLVVVLVGLAVGLSLPFLLVPAVDLTPFTGGAESPTRLNLPLALGLAGGLVVVVVLAAWLTLAMERRRGADAIRIGDLT